MMTEDDIRNRLTQLRMKKGVSEYQMSLDLGHSKSYIQSITSGRALPSMSEFLVICDYLGITPQEFFDTSTSNPLLVKEITEKLCSCSDEDLQLIFTIISRINRYTELPALPGFHFFMISDIYYL